MKNFLPEKPPLKEIARKEFWKLNDIMWELPYLYTTGKIRAEIERLPVIDTSFLVGQEFDCALRDYNFLAAAYYHARHQPPINYFHESIARPLFDLSKRLGKVPGLSYCSYCLQNCESRFDNELVTIEESRIIRKFTFGADEEGFILVHYVIEALFELPLVLACVDASRKYDREALTAALNKVHQNLQQLLGVMAQMPKWCNPDVYYLEVRPPIQFYEKVIFHGVDELNGPIPLIRGETGAQSNIPNALDGMLGVEHQPTGLTDFLADMRHYMPPVHVQTVDEIRRLSKVRQVAQSTRNSELAKAYNIVIKDLYDFRDLHLKYAHQYIFDKVGDTTGTGHTPADKFLKQIREETAAHLIS